MSNPIYAPGIREWTADAYERGHSIKMIRAALFKRGHRPSWSTVIRWANREFKGGAEEDWRTIRGRMTDLRSLNVSYRSIAAIVGHDYGVTITEDQARRILSGQTREESVKLILEGGRAPVGRPAGAQEVSDQC